MKKRIVLFVLSILLLSAQSARADSISFSVTFNSSALGMNGQFGLVAFALISLPAVPNSQAFITSFSAPGALGSIDSSFGTAGNLGSTLLLTPMPGGSLPFYDSALGQFITFPGQLTFDVTIDFATGNGVFFYFLAGVSQQYFACVNINFSTVTCDENNGIRIIQPTLSPGTLNTYVGNSGSFTFTQIPRPQIGPVPEPATLLLVGIGLAGVWLIRRK